MAASWLQAATGLVQVVSATTSSMASTGVGVLFCAWSCFSHGTADKPPSVPPDEAGELDGDLLNSSFLATASDWPARGDGHVVGEGRGTRHQEGLPFLGFVSVAGPSRLHCPCNGSMEPYRIPVPAHPRPLGANDGAVLLLIRVLLMARLTALLLSHAAP